MSNVLGTVQLWALAASFHVLAGSALAAALWRPMRARFAAMPPASRAHLLFAVAVAPVAGGTLLATLCFVPSVLSQVGLAVDHCMDHHHHPHLCVVHGRARVNAVVAGALGVAGLAGVLYVAVRIRATRRTRRWLGALSAAAVGAGNGVRVVESTLPVAVTTGLWRPQIVLSSGLIRSLGTDVATVIEHERAHARRRDGLVRLAASSLSLVHAPWVRRVLLDDLNLACEQACDEEAAARTGDRLQVASAIVAVERLLARAPVLEASAFHGATAIHRIEALLGEPLRAPDRRLARWYLSLAIAALVVMADPLHHVTETLLSVVAR